MDKVMDKFLTVDVSVDTLKKYCLWTIVKFFKDDFHIQNSSSKNDLLGGFMDRWINRIPESLIFQELLKNENFDVVNDDFFYLDESAKNAPDVIGLVRYKNDHKFSEFESLNDDEEMRFYQFYTFDINQWSKFDEDAPFIEMKTTRNSQKLATIAKRQENIDKNYFALVESNINDYYLLYLLDKEIFKNLINFNVDNSFFKNDLDIIELPNLAINKEINRLVKEKIISLDNEIKSVGDYKLCGIFKGSTIKDYSSEVGLEDGEPISPRYLKSIDEVYENVEVFDETFNCDYYSDQFKSIPIFIDVLDNSSIFIENLDDNGNVISDKELVVSVEGQVELYDLNRNHIDTLDNGFHNLKFDSFISNLYKIYYFHCRKPADSSTLKLNANRKKLDSGILSFYGDNFINNKFDLKTIFDLNAEIYDCSKSTIVYKYFSDGNREDSKEIFCKMYFKNNGDQKDDPESVNPIKKNQILLGHDESHLNLRFEVDNNSKLRFLKKNKSSFVICVDNTVNIYDGASDEPHEIKDDYYEFEIKERSKNKNKYFEIIESKTGDDANPDIAPNDVRDLPIDDNGFFIPDDIASNIKIKIDLIDNSHIKIINESKSKNKYKNGYKKTNYLYIIVEGDGKARINGKCIKDEENIFKKVWKLSFDDFERTGKKTEYILSKDAIMYSDVSCEEELINCFKSYIQKLDRIQSKK